MTLVRVKATGRGKLLARVAPDGWPYEFVTDRSMERTAADGRVRIRGLRLDTLRKGARADLMRASLRAQGFRVVVEDVTRGNLATLALSKRPSLTTWLTPAGASITDGAATLDVADTTGWPATGYGHIGTETFSYGGKTATSFTTCVRGLWGTVAQAHYAPDGAGLSYPRITNIPPSLEGRRVRVYLYGDGDDPQGDGTLEVFGVASTDRSYEDGAWSFSVDPITRLLDQEVGGDLEAPVPVRGIYYPWNAPFAVSISAPNIGRSVTVRLTGFYADQQAFCTALSTKIATAVTGWPWIAGSSITAQVLDASSAWQLVYRVGTGPAGTVADVTLSTMVAMSLAGDSAAGTYSDLDVFETAGWRGDDDAPVASSGFAAGRVYRQRVDASVPRGAFGSPSPRETGVERAGLEPDETGAPFSRLYLGGLVVPTTDMAAMLEQPGGDDPVPLSLRSGVDVTNRWISVDSPFRTVGPGTKIHFGRNVALGSIETFRNALALTSYTVANAGGMPLITTADWAYSAEAVEAAGESSTGYRRFQFYQGIKLRELVEHELRAIGCYMRINAAGAMEAKRLRPRLVTDSSAWTFDERSIIGRPRVERAAFGYLASVLYRTGYDPREDEWKSHVQVRDVAITSPTRVAGELEIAQRSFAPDGDPSHDDVVRTASPILGLFGGPYDIVTLKVSLKALGVLIGDACLITHPHYPADDGTLGVTALPGMITGYDFELGAASGTVEVLVHGQRFAGYAPGFRVTGQSPVAGNTWDVTINLSDYSDAAAASSILTVGDLVRVTEQDNATPTQLNGTVDSFQSATVVRVTFTGVWTPGVVEWCLRARPSTAYADVETGLGRYAFVAEATRKVDYGTTDADAREWSS